MKKYLVYVEEIYIERHEVEADTPRQAKMKVNEGKGKRTGKLIYVCQSPVKKWIVHQIGE